MADVNQEVGTMGMQGTINMTSQMMADALKAIETYRGSIETATSNLDAQYATVKANFTGDAANGLQEFYTNKIDSMLHKESGNIYKLLDALKSICESIRDQIPGDSGVDNEMGKVNRQ
ncbi:hypothetical protein [uncultured Ruminococcus sp.]|uniref:hypothetical protein n=1 Tax=uncultured Ruminococcus sp. TaxID=165186 RepID=UPI000EB8E08D|nr:hypothetical protein [uncultured Ruminococcus sp.]HCJ41283.1 hypothetical protein [Ruminococcus sp.]